LAASEMSLTLVLGRASEAAGILSFAIALYELFSTARRRASAFFFGLFIVFMATGNYVLRDGGFLGSAKRTVEIEGKEKVGPPPPPPLPWSVKAILEPSAQSESVCFTQSGRILVVGGGDGTITFWDVVRGAKQNAVRAHSRKVLSIGFSLDGSLMTTTGEDNTLRLWDVPTNVVQGVWRNHDEIATTDFGGRALLAGSDTIIWATGYEEVRLVQVASGSSSKMTVGRTGWTRALAMSRDGRTFAAAGQEGEIAVWRFQGSNSGPVRLRAINWDTEFINALAFGHDSMLAAGDDSGVLKIWDAQSGSLLRTLIGHNSGVRAVSFNEGGTLLASASTNEVFLWNPETGEQLNRISVGIGISSLALDAKGDALATVGSEVVVWRR
jgi:WD40 repeat protein